MMMSSMQPITASNAVSAAEELEEETPEKYNAIYVFKLCIKDMHSNWLSCTTSCYEICIMVGVIC